MKIHALSALADNYIWALCEGPATVLVDPGEAQPALDFLAAAQRTLTAILLTHKHADHIGGVAQLRAAYPAAVVVAPATEGHEHATRTVAAGETLTLAGWSASFSVHATPGHTTGHLSYADSDVLLCGDALFSCGCGRLFEGDAADLAASMQVFQALPDALQVCCGHEYTLTNIAFAQAVEPANRELATWATQAAELRARGAPTLPVTLAHERAVNPFLRAAVPAVHAAAAQHAGHELADETAVLGALRAWKDHF